MNKLKVAIITGASQGIGKSTAEKFASSGYHLALVGRNAAALQQVKAVVEKEHPIEAVVCAGDLSVEDFWEELVTTVLDRWGRINALVNNAAWRKVAPLEMVTLADWDKTLRICLTAPAFLAKRTAEIMAKQENGGVIINVSSIMSQRVGGYGPAYIACKGALESLTYELATLYGPRRIRVVCVNPGNVLTDMSTDYRDEAGNNISKQLLGAMNDHTPLMRAGHAAEIASAIRWLASEEASFITGTTVVVDGGFSHNLNSYTLKRLQFPQSF